MKKGGNGYKNQKRREAKPVPKPNPMFRNQIAGNVLEIALGGFCGLQTTPFHLEAIKPRKELEKIRKPKLWEIAEHAISISYGKLRSMP